MTLRMNKLDRASVAHAAQVGIMALMMMGSEMTSAFAASSQGSTIMVPKSSLAILTEKEGVAAALAHRHIIVATNWTAELRIDRKVEKMASLAAITSGSATILIPVKDLIVDSPDASAGIVGFLGELKLWNPKDDRLEPGNAKKVRENMLDESQLDVAKYPNIEGSGRFSSCQAVNESSTRCSLELTLKIRGRVVTKKLPLVIRYSGGELIAEFSGSFAFSEFGIKPYTALMGAIAVKDGFTLASRIVALGD